MPGQTFVDQRAFDETIRKINRDITAIKQSGSGGGSVTPGGEPAIAAGTVAQYWRGDKTWQTLNQAAVAGLTTGDSPAWISVRIADSNDSHHLALVWNEDRTADQTLNLITGAANRTITLIGDPTLSDWFDQAVKVVSRPTHQEMFLGPEGSEAATRLVFKSYFDFGTSGSAERVAGHITGEGTGEAASGTADVPGTRGTEWNLETHQFVSAAGLTQDAYPNGCLGGGLLITNNTTTGVFEGYSVTTGALVRSSPAHGFSQMRGLCSDGTNFYATGILTAGNARVIAKYQISDFSLLATWASAWPELQSPWEVRYNGGFVYTFCQATRYFFKINVTTMLMDSSFLGPESSPGTYYQICSFDIDTAGTYIYAIAAIPPAGNYYIVKANLSDGTFVATGTDAIDSSGSSHILHYSEGAEERFYVAMNQGLSQAGKINPSTLGWYYAAVNIGHLPLGIAADATYLYAFFEDEGIDRHLKNSIAGSASTEAGILRFWINALGSITAAGMIDSNLDLMMMGDVEGVQLKSTAAIGTPPLTIISTTMCQNLNADLLDGNHAAAFEPAIAAGTTAQYWRGDKTWQTLNQAAIPELTTASSPTFAGLTLTKTETGYAATYKQITQTYSIQPGGDASSRAYMAYGLSTEVPATNAQPIQGVYGLNGSVLVRGSGVVAAADGIVFGVGNYATTNNIKAGWFYGDNYGTISEFFYGIQSHIHNWSAWGYTPGSIGTVRTLRNRIQNDVLTSGIGNATITTAQICYGSVYNESLHATYQAIIGSAAGFEYDLANVGVNAIITNSYGAKFNTPSNTGTITNHYGIYLADQTVAGTTANYALYSAGGAWYIAGLISTPTISLTNLTDDYIPYHVNDSTGLANGPTKTDVDSAVSLKHAAVTLGNYTSRILTLTGQILTTPVVNEKKFYAGPTSGADAAPDFRLIAVADLPTVTVPYGGTGKTVFVVGDILHATATTTIAGLADVAVGSYLRSGGVGTVPLWSTLILPNSATANQIVYATSTNTWGGGTGLTYDGTNLLISGGITSPTATALIIRPTANLDFTPGGTALVRMTSGVRIQSDNFASQTTGWGISYAGAGDFRYLYADELHAKAFIADLEQALAGGQIICKSVAPLAAVFTIPAAGANATLVVESFKGFDSFKVFVDGDFIRLRQFDRTGTSLTISNCWGTVVWVSTDTTAKTQTYTFTRSAAPNAGTASGTIGIGVLALDYGTTGNGFLESNAIDGAMAENAPYHQIVSWTTHPNSGPIVRTRLGNLKGIFNTANEYGLYAGEGILDASQYLRISDQAAELHNISLKMFDGATNTVLISPTAPSFALGNPLPTAYGTGAGIWMGKDTLYKFRAGNPGGHGIFWDGTNLAWDGVNTSLTAAGAFAATSATITGAITANTGYIGGTGGWVIAAGQIQATNAILASNGTEGYISFGTTPPTAYGNNAGAFLGSSAVAGGKFSLYKDSSNYLQWDGTSLAIKSPYVTINSAGIRVPVGTNWAQYHSYDFDTGYANSLTGLYAFRVGSSQNVYLSSIAANDDGDSFDPYTYVFAQSHSQYYDTVSQIKLMGGTLNTTMEFYLQNDLEPIPPAVKTMSFTFIGGNVGFGARPQSKLYIKMPDTGWPTDPTQVSNSAIHIYNSTNVGDTSIISFGYTVSGLYLRTSAYMGYVSTNTVGAGFGDLVFGTRVAAEVDPIERVRITSGGNVGIGVAACGTSAVKVLGLGTGTAPASSPVDMFQMYSADQAAGNAAPHFRTENGAIVKLYQQAHLADAYTSYGASLDAFDEVATALNETNTLLNSVLARLENLGFSAAA